MKINLIGQIEEPSILENFLNAHFEFRSNKILGRIEIKAKAKGGDFIELTELNFNTIIRLVIQNGLEIKPSDLRRTLNSDFVKIYDPFIDYVETLPQWNEGDIDYIYKLAETVKVEIGLKNHWHKCLTKWLVATIGCAIDSQITNQTVLILTGGQGLGKTSWLDSLMPPELMRYYYTGAINLYSKDSLIHLSECFIINLDELGGFLEHKDDRFKEIITKSHIRIRRPYRADTEDMPRRCSFVGSTNRCQFLNDSTGSRRILAFEVFDIKQLDFPIKYVWAQAYSLLKSGFQYWFDRDEALTLNHLNTKYLIRSIEEEIIMSNFEVCGQDEKPDFSLTTSQIFQFLVKADPSTRRCSLKSLGSAMQKSGFVPRKSNGLQLYDVKMLGKDIPRFKNE